MKSIIFHLVLVVAYLLMGQVTGNGDFSVNWALSYMIFCTPFLLLLLSSALVPPGKVKIFSCLSWGVVLTGALLIFTNQQAYILSAIAWFFLIASAFALAISLVVKTINIMACRSTRT